MSKRKLLLADDSITIQKVVNLTFADQGIDVIAFGDGDRAYAVMNELEPDIVLADVNVPGLNGYQLCELIRGNERTRHVPVVLLVGSFEPFDQGEADRAGANSFLTKPFSSIGQLVATVSDLLDKAPSVDLSTGDLEMPETNDIDSLYQQSFAETAELPSGENLDVEFSDDGIDDEMIQTSYGESDIDDLADASFFERSELDDFISGSDTQSPVLGEADAPIDRDLYVPETFEAADSETAAEDEQPNVDSQVQFATADTMRFETNDLESTSLKFQFDQIDLLELPEVPSGKSYEFATAQQAADTGSHTQVVSLSPELIEIIVQKVVEKLAEKY